MARLEWQGGCCCCRLAAIAKCHSPSCIRLCNFTKPPDTSIVLCPVCLSLESIFTGRQSTAAGPAWQPTSVCRLQKPGSLYTCDANLPSAQPAKIVGNLRVVLAVVPAACTPVRTVPGIVFNTCSVLGSGGLRATADSRVLPEQLMPTLVIAAAVCHSA
jgi:hypothetical protein